MPEFSDSTRRLVIFVAIVLGGSVLLIFDIPVLYLMMVVIGIAVILLVITGTIILSEIIRSFINKFRSRPKKPKKEKIKKDKSSISGKFSFPSLSLPKLKMPARDKKEKEKPKKVKENKKGKQKDNPSGIEDTSEDLGEIQGSDTDSSGSDDTSFDDADLLDGLDLDDSLDIDAELDAVTPEFDNVRTPYGEKNAMDSLPSVKDVKKMDIATSEEEETITLDRDQGEDEINEIYSSSIDIGSDSGGEVISDMEGGDTISSSDLSLYSSSEDSPYQYGQEDESGGEEQFELSQVRGGGDDDLIASLKADIEDLKKRDDDVLLRDLKDVHVSAEELSEELKEIMNIINRKIKKR
jgi:hypothetical protein